VPLIEKKVTIINKFGLHARPAMRFVETANKFSCSIDVSKESLKVDAKSIMAVMRLAAAQNAVLTILVDGEDAEEAMEALTSLIESGFDEEE
jgi:phosphocarrier protein